MSMQTAVLKASTTERIGALGHFCLWFAAQVPHSRFNLPDVIPTRMSFVTGTWFIDGFCLTDSSRHLPLWRVFRGLRFHQVHGLY